MAEQGFSIKVEISDGFKAALQEAASMADDLSVPLGLILKDFYKTEKIIFALKGPGKYEDYKYGADSKYGKLKEKKAGFRYPLLVGPNRKGHEGGALAASVLAPDAPGSIGRIGKKELEIGTSISYAASHQFGSSKRSIARRPFLFIGNEFAVDDSMMNREDKWAIILKDEVKRRMKKAGLKTDDV